MNNGDTDMAPTHQAREARPQERSPQHPLAAHTITQRNTGVGTSSLCLGMRGRSLFPIQAVWLGRNALRSEQLAVLGARPREGAPLDRRPDHGLRRSRQSDAPPPSVGVTPRTARPVPSVGAASQPRGVGGTGERDLRESRPKTCLICRKQQPAGRRCKT